MARFLRFITGPELYRIYDVSSSPSRTSANYVGNAAERYGSWTLSLVSTTSNFCVYASPFLLAFLYRRDMLSPSGAVTISKFLTFGVCAFFLALNLRAIGRAANPTYRRFLQILDDGVANGTRAFKAFDFEFGSWPVEFRVTSRPGRSPVPRTDGEPPWSWVTTPLAWLMVKTFGIKLVYPGSMQIMQSFLAEPLQEGRAKWVLEKGGERFKLEAANGNAVDVMFFDRRRSSGNGSTLVISCEGNAGFYEIGVLSTPVDLNFSVLGWNHPGFGGSTGSPFPSEEASAADAVMQFAIQKLGFSPGQILVHGWSIGGFAATWLAMNYPEVKGVILDASFDELLPLAKPRMPEILQPLVVAGVNNFINLDIAEQLKSYDGPVLILRRLLDEMIAEPSGSLESNRGNDLLTKVLMHRYPSILPPFSAELQVVKEFLSLKEPLKTQMLQKHGVDGEVMKAVYAAELERSHIRKGDPWRSANVGSALSPQQRLRLGLYLVTKYSADFDSTHCTPLPPEFFRVPWDPFRSKEDDSFIKI